MTPSAATAAILAALLGVACSRGRGSSSALAAASRICLRETTTIPFAVGDTATLQAGPVDASDSVCVSPSGPVKWSSSNARVITISEAGFATAVAPGRAVISAAISQSKGERVGEGGAAMVDSATFMVVPTLRDIRIVPDSVTLSLGDSAVFRVVTAGQSAAVPVWWYSEDAAVSFVRPGSRAAPASLTAASITVWAAQPGTALLEAGTRYLRDAAHVRVVVR